MTKRLALMALFFILPGSALWAATETLESPALRIELNTSPYSFRVIERSTGDVLLSQSNTIFKFVSELYPATDATGNPRQGPSGLHIHQTRSDSGPVEI